MKNLRNQVQLIGNLGADPEMREFSTGNNKVSIRLATSDYYKNKAGEKVTDTQWHHVVAWNGTGKYIKNYATKGTEIMVQGKLTHSSYEDKNGVTKYVTEVVADQVMILSKKEKES
ncbi:MAG: single-stranded DNA-binding protein [Bacteroidales bacterium]|nr:single-stranded DNA-binding protein [Bacteroidales bacterium]